MRVGEPLATATVGRLVLEQAIKSSPPVTLGLGLPRFGGRRRGAVLAPTVTFELREGDVEGAIARYDEALEYAPKWKALAKAREAAMEKN